MNRNMFLEGLILFLAGTLGYFHIKSLMGMMVGVGIARIIISLIEKEKQ